MIVIIKSITTQTTWDKSQHYLLKLICKTPIFFFINNCSEYCQYWKLNKFCIVKEIELRDFLWYDAYVHKTESRDDLKCLLFVSIRRGDKCFHRGRYDSCFGRDIFNTHLWRGGGQGMRNKIDAAEPAHYSARLHSFQNPPSHRLG